MTRLYFSKTIKETDKFSRLQSVSETSGYIKTTILRIRSLKSVFIALFMIPLLWSCEFLNYTEIEQYDAKYIFSYIDQSKAVLSNIYSYFPNDFSSVDGAMRSSASDDAEHVWDISSIQKFNDGTWSSILTLDDQWGRMYSGIRAVNNFLEGIKGNKFSDYQYNDDYIQLMTAFAKYPYEARFLRAYFYFELIKRYGKVPLIKGILTSDDANNLTQATYDELVKFIVDECDSAILKLPEIYSTPDFVSGETGRATKGAAMALKARTLLYAASPLNNPSGDQQKWIAAAQASKQLIDQLGHLGNNRYSPLPAYTAAVNNLSSKELILERREVASRSFETNNTAVGFYGGNTGTCPTQNLVDSYEMKATGLGINEPGSGYNPADPYAGRDPRFAMSILYNDATWKSPNKIQVYHGGLNGPPTPNTTKTGYYIKKYMIESISLGPSGASTAIHYWVIFRYAEILLNYAEAMNEAYGPEVTGPAPLNNLTALQAVNLVRARTGIAMPAFPAGMSKSAFRDKLRNERRVELAFEDHRFWDIRRWKIGDQTTVIKGVDITKNAVSGALTFTPKLVETRIWNDKMLLYPIPQTELFINKKIIQNTGW